MRAEVVELASDRPIPIPPVRIRTVLLVVLVVLVAYKVYPRAVAAWQVHGLAASLADYALCMVGPTGPSLIRDNPDEFARLVRRRLVIAATEDRPFSECVGLARAITGSQQVAEAHEAQASDYQEYEAGWRTNGAPRRLEELKVTSEPLADMSRRAWPFVRGGYTRLVKPSLSASEAVHPVAPPDPVVGHGLPQWRARYRAVRRTQSGFVMAQGQGANLSVFESRDEGVSWKPISANRQPNNSLERCPIDDDGRSFTFSSSDDGQATLVQSLGPDGAPYATVLGPAEHQVFAAACDADGLVVATQAGKGHDKRLFLCPFRRSCAPMHLPASGARLSQLSDVARVSGTTVVSFSSGRIVRIASSRDAGRSWTPLSVAFDAYENPPATMGLSAPDRLLALDDSLLLYGGATRPDVAYLVLLSDDHGASWRTP